MERPRFATGASSNAMTNAKSVDPHCTGFGLDLEDAPGGGIPG